MKSKYRRHFLLDSTVGHLNHGAYGATPLSVLKRQWSWQREMERRPVEFLARRQEELLLQARIPVARFLGARVENTAFVVNSTTAINWVARSLPLGPGDEVLLNAHEYGAVLRCFRVLAQERGFSLVQAPEGDLLAALQQAASPQTRLVVVSHLTSPTAQCFDVESVGRWARERGIWSLVDGAHGPGHVPLALDDLGVDFYAGNLHKWLWSPKGAAILWVAPQVQALIRPIFVSWGVDPLEPLIEPDWVAWMQMQATRDPSAFLASPAGLDYQERYHEPWLESHCLSRLEGLSAQLEALGAIPLPWSRPLKMRAFAWPFSCDPVQLQRTLLQNHRVEVPFYFWEGQLMFRVSMQHYVCDSELERLLRGLSESRVAASP